MLSPVRQKPGGDLIEDKWFDSVGESHAVDNPACSLTFLADDWTKTVAPTTPPDTRPLLARGRGGLDMFLHFSKAQTSQFVIQWRGWTFN